MNPKKNRLVALVTGGTGFVGSHLVKRLRSDGWHVHLLSRKNHDKQKVPAEPESNSHFYDGTTESVISILDKVKPNVVFHLASLFLAQHESADIKHLIESNVLLGAQILEGMRLTGVSRMINTGTSWQHFNNEKYNPVCFYASTKQAFESILTYYVEAYKFNVVTLKLFDTYGPDDSRNKLFKILNDAAINNQEINMSMGDQLIDIVYIDDVINAYILAAKNLIKDSNKKHQIYSVSSGKPMRLRDLVALYLKLTEKKVKINWGARPYRFREVMIPWTNGIKISGWSVKTQIELGIKKLNSKK